jgi:hypothetical protein
MKVNNFCCKSIIYIFILLNCIYEYSLLNNCIFISKKYNIFYNLINQNIQNKSYYCYTRNFNPDSDLIVYVYISYICTLLSLFLLFLTNIKLIFKYISIWIIFTRIIVFGYFLIYFNKKDDPQSENINYLYILQNIILIFCLHGLYLIIICIYLCCYDLYLNLNNLNVLKNEDEINNKNLVILTKYSTM